MQTFWRTLAATVAMLLTMPATLWADSAFGGGNGTFESPYQIRSAADLIQLAEDVNSGITYKDKYFIQFFDIDFCGDTLTPIGGKYYVEFNPSIGSEVNGERSFMGNYDGWDHYINNVIIDPGNGDFYSVGLFGSLSNEAVVECVLIGGNSTITGRGNCGAIAGLVGPASKVKNCHVGPDVVVRVHPDASTNTNFSYGGIAGLVARASSTVENCSSLALVTDQGVTGKNVGGLVGHNMGIIKNCYSLGKVESVGTKGNFVAKSTNGTITNGYYNTTDRVGEVNGADVDEVKWIGTVLGEERINCNVLGPVHIFRDYFIGNKYYLIGEKVYLRPSFNAPPAHIVNSVTFGANVNLESDTYNGENCLSFTMPDANVLITANADYQKVGVWDGDGTPESPFLVTSTDEWNSIAQLQDQVDFTNVHFRLDANLDFSQKTFLMIGNRQQNFMGCFDGNSHTIDGVTLNEPQTDYVGLFGYLGRNAVVKNLTLGENSHITGNTSVGGICGRGYFDCVVDACVNKGTVTGNRDVGGIVGYIYGKLTNSLNLGDILCEDYSHGAIAGGIYSDNFANNYYAGSTNTKACPQGDYTGVFMRGYTVTGDEEVTVELAEDATVGLTFDGITYAGEAQMVTLKLGVKQDQAQGAPAYAPSTTAFKASNGTLVENADGTWTLTMPADSVTISIDKGSFTGLNELDSPQPKSGRRYNPMGQPVGNGYRGIVIQDGRKFIVR